MADLLPWLTLPAAFALDALVAAWRNDFADRQ